jgi:hypothetical protein
MPTYSTTVSFPQVTTPAYRQRRRTQAARLVTTSTMRCHPGQKRARCTPRACTGACTDSSPLPTTQRDSCRRRPNLQSLDAIGARSTELHHETRRLRMRSCRIARRHRHHRESGALFDAISHVPDRCVTRRLGRPAGSPIEHEKRIGGKMLAACRLPGRLDGTADPRARIVAVGTADATRPLRARTAGWPQCVRVVRSPRRDGRCRRWIQNALRCLCGRGARRGERRTQRCGHGGFCWWECCS